MKSLGKKSMSTLIQYFFWCWVLLLNGLFMSNAVAHSSNMTFYRLVEGSSGWQLKVTLAQATVDQEFARQAGPLQSEAATMDDKKDWLLKYLGASIQLVQAEDPLPLSDPTVRLGSHESQVWFSCKGLQPESREGTESAYSKLRSRAQPPQCPTSERSRARHQKIDFIG